MKSHKTSIIFSLLFVVFLIATSSINYINDDKSTYVADKLVEMGAKKPLHYISKPDSLEIKKGYELVTKGWTTHNGSKSKFISKHFVCTDCHNIVQEDPDLANPNATDRLSYAMDHKIPYLQGSTLYGIVNREHWYNGDYDKKYGDLVVPARDTLVNAIQLCAKVCSQGRYLEDWEATAMLHYLNSIGLTLADIDVSSQDLKGKDNDKNAAFLTSKYAKISPATFVDPIPRKERKMGKKGNPDNGKAIYELSCLHCHGREKSVARTKLDQTKITLKYLSKNLKNDSEYSMYQITRKGTYPHVGSKPYMPHYPLDRLSNEQLEDLVSYIKKGK